MGHMAALSAFRDGQEWLDQALSYLRANRDFLAQYLKEKLPNLHDEHGGHLSRVARLQEFRYSRKPIQYFLREAKVALNDGAEFGKGGEGFVRLNLACPRKTLSEGPWAYGRCSEAAVIYHDLPNGIARTARCFSWRYRTSGGNG